VADTSPTDWRFVDQIEYSPTNIGLAFRSFSPYQPTAPGPRHLRIFTSYPTDFFAANPNLVAQSTPLLDTTSALKQTVISQEVLQALPNRVDMWAITKVIPSVVLDKVDVGGSEAFIQSRATVHGSSQESGYYIDGLDVSSLDGNQTGATFYMDPFAYQETNYQLGGAGLAATSRDGLIYNGISRTGTNQIHGGYTYSGMSRGMQWHNFTPDLRLQVLAAIPQKVRDVNPNIQPFADFLTNYDTGLWIGGPIVKDKVWFSGSTHYQVLNQYPLGGYDPDGR